jgi:hypothetical protein
MIRSRPCIIGRPGRMATFQNDKREPLRRKRPLHQVVSPTECTAGRHQNVSYAADAGSRTAAAALPR